jgi:hypothetical protein
MCQKEVNATVMSDKKNSFFFAKLLRRLAFIFAEVTPCLRENVTKCENRTEPGSCSTAGCKFILAKVLVTYGKNFLDLHLTINFKPLS